MDAKKCCLVFKRVADCQPPDTEKYPELPWGETRGRDALIKTALNLGGHEKGGLDLRPISAVEVP